MDWNKRTGLLGRRGSRRPGRTCPAGALGLALLAAGLCPGGSLAGPPTENSVTLDGLTCRYPARARWLADRTGSPGGPRRLVLDIACDTGSGRDPRALGLPTLTLLDAAGHPYPGDIRTETPQRADAESNPAPSGQTLGVRALFALPSLLPVGPWQLQLTQPGRTVQLPLGLPSD